MTVGAHPTRAFADPARESQAVFRVAMAALSRPGSVHALTPSVRPPHPLRATTAALILTLCDFETPLWLDPCLARAPEVVQFLRFHSGAACIEPPEQAAFAVVCDAFAMPPLAAFRQGDLAYPDRSTTVIIEVERFEPSPWRLSGPGVRGQMPFGASPLPPGLLAELADNRSRFPLGIDLFLAAPDAVAALPRSLHIEKA